MELSAPAPRRDARVIGLVGSGHFLSHFYMLALPPLFPLLKAEFGVSYAALGGIVTVFALASGCGQLPMGFVVDRFGARYVLVSGMVLMSGSMVLAGFATSYAWIPFLFMFAGLGNSVFHPADYAILASAVREDRVARAFSLHTFSGYGGWAAAPPVMIFLSTTWNWRVAVIVMGVLGLLVALVMLKQRHLLENDTGPARARRGGHATGPALRRDLAILFSPGVLLLFGFFVLSAATTIGLNAFSVAALVALHGVDLSAAGAGLTVFLVMASLGVLVGGPIADRTRRYDVISAVGFIGAAAAISTVGLVPVSLALAIAALGVTGFMLGVTLPSRDMLVRALSPRGSTGKVFGFVSTGIEIGAAGSPILFGWLIDQGAPENIFLSSAVFMIGMLAFALATAAAVRRRDARR